MTWSDAVLLARRVARALACRVGLHDWDYWGEADDGLLAIDHRECRIAACGRHEVWMPDSRRWIAGPGGSFL